MSFKKISESECEFSINPGIYPEEVIEEAIAAFKGVCSIKNTRGRSYRMKIKAGTDVTDIKEAYGEFFNYLLGLVKNR